MKYQRMATSDSQSVLALGDRRSFELSDERGIDGWILQLILHRFRIPGATASVPCAHPYYAQENRERHHRDTG